MSSDENDQTDGARRERQAEAGRIAEARSTLAAIDTAVLAGRRGMTRAEQRKALARAVAALLANG